MIELVQKDSGFSKNIELSVTQDGDFTTVSWSRNRDGMERRSMRLKDVVLTDKELDYLKSECLDER